MKFNQSKKFKKQIGLAVISCMLIQALPASIFNAKEVYAATGLRHVAVGNSEVILGGNYIEVAYQNQVPSEPQIKQRVFTPCTLVSA